MFLKCKTRICLLFQLRCEFGRDRVTHFNCPSFPEVHFDKQNSNADSCAIVVRKIESHHEGG